MATPKQGKELHQLKLKLTKDPRATTVKPPTPTKQSPPKIGTVSISDQPKAPAAKVLKLSDVIIVPARNPSTRSLPTKPASKSTTATSVTQQPSVAHPPTVKSPRQQQVTLISPPIVVKSPRKKQTVLVNPQVVKQVKQQVTLVNPVVVKSPSKARQQPALISGGEGSTKHKPPPLNLVVVRPEPKQASKRQNKRSSQSILPTSRVRTIMKTNIKSSSSDGPLNIGQDSVAVISKATVCTHPCLSCLVASYYYV